MLGGGVGQVGASEREAQFPSGTDETQLRRGLDGAQLLSGLNEAQREAVTHAGGPLLVLAGAGSGKTRVLARRAAWLVAGGEEPRGVLCITFTNKAAREMRERVAALVGPGALDMWVSTFHAACARLLRQEADEIGFPRNYTILDEDDQRDLVREVLADLNLSERRWPVGMVLSLLSRAKDRLETPEDMARRGGEGDEALARIYAAYQEKLRRHDALDFGDLILYAVQLLEGRAEVLARYRRRFRHVLVDEYQDTNHAQYRLVRALAGEHRRLFCVGDADQAIYGWRGADYGNILHFTRDFPDARVVRLEENYRSTAAILSVADQVIRHNRLRPERSLRPRREGGRRPVWWTARDELHEAALVAEEMVRLHLEEGRPWGHFAVLYRTHAQSRVLEEVLLRRGVPYVIVGGFRFYERREVKDVLAYLRLVVNPRDRLSFQRVVNAPRRGIGPATLARLESFALARGLELEEALARVGEVPGIMPPQARALAGFHELILELRRQAAALPVYELLQEVMARTGYRRWLLEEFGDEGLSRTENLDELLTVAREFERGALAAADGGTAGRDGAPPAGEGATGQDGARPAGEGAEAGLDAVARFLETVALASGADEETGGERVSLMTLHAAKGLEFPVVFLTGLEEGVFPHLRSLESQEGLEEERRLFYVGLTRARDLLYLLDARCRTLHGAPRDNVPSRFLAEFDPDLVERRTAEDRAALRPHGSPADGAGGRGGAGRSAGGGAGDGAGRSAGDGAGSSVGRNAAGGAWAAGLRSGRAGAAGGWGEP